MYAKRFFLYLILVFSSIDATIVITLTDGIYFEISQSVPSENVLAEYFALRTGICPL
jgi:hypothetical protein